MNKFTTLIISSFLLFGCTSGCKENSPLSDVELSDPELISPEITITKTLNERGREQTDLVVFLNDKNNNSIDLLKGGVLINNRPLSVSFDGEAPYYGTSIINLITEKEYSVKIKLADNESYPCIVKSPKKLLGSLNLDEYHNMTKPLVVYWDYNDNPNTKYFLEVRHENQTQEELLELSPIEARMGFHSFSPQFLEKVTEGKGGDILVTLKAVTSGVVSAKFNGGSIQIVESTCRQVTLGSVDADVSFFNKKENEEGQHKLTPKKPKEEAKKTKEVSGFGWLKFVLFGAGGLLFGFILFSLINKKK